MPGLNVKDICKNAYKDIITVAGLMVVVTVLLFVFYDLGARDLTVPISYSGGDDMSLLNTVRLVQEGGWNSGTDRIAATDEYYYNNNEILSGLHNGDIILAGFGLLIAGGQNVGLAANISYLTIFYLITLVSYFVLRQLKLKQWIAAAGSLVYAFLAFVFMRGIPHIGLASCYFVPLAVLMAVWIYEDEKFMLIGKDFLKYKRNYLGMVMAFLIATQGLGYWQVFACFFLFVSATVGFIRSRDWIYINRGFTGIMCIVISVIICCIPVFITMSAADATVVSRPRSIAEAEYYGLKIIQLFMPVNGHGIDFIQNKITAYNDNMPLVNENQTAYLGLAGIAGFVVLAISLFMDNKNSSERKKRLSVLADMNICAIVLATIGGVGSIVYVAVFDMLRCYNRISAFIAYICIMALCIVADAAFDKIKKNYLKAMFAVVFCSFMMFALWEQNPGVVKASVSYETKWNSDEKFIDDVENVMNDNSKVFQLPYVPYPEVVGGTKMPALEHLTGYIHSDKLRWSFGTVTGSESDKWCESASKLAADDMINALQEKEFEGIYINRNGYDENEWKTLEALLQQELSVEPIISDDGRLSFFKLN